MLEIFQAAVTHEFRNPPASLDFVQTIENAGLLETLGRQRELDALQKTPAFSHRPEGMTAMADPTTDQRRQTNPFDPNNPKKTTEQSEKTHGQKD
jgi:hypothetical protein